MQPLLSVIILLTCFARPEYRILGAAMTKDILEKFP